MLTLNTGSVCDVCSEDYGPHRLPHSIPCGHVLCFNCCNTIIQKTPPRLSPACPFCREQFDDDSIRVIRIDFTVSRWNTPRLKTVTLGPVNDLDDPSHDDRILLKPGNRTREEARRLEDRVAKVAVKKCSVEEVSSLHKELTHWLMSDSKSDSQTSALSLSAALLRAILTNHLAHSDAMRAAKNAEQDLQARLEDAELTIGKLEAEIRRQKALHAQKVQECQSLSAEMSRLKLITTTLALPPNRSTTASPTSESRALPPSNSPTPPATYGAASPSLLSRFNSTHSTHSTTSTHSRSISMTSRPNTPAVPPRSHTPAPVSSVPPRSHTPAPTATPPRSHTPGLTTTPPRSHTPAPSIPRSHTPAPSIPRSHTPSIRSQTPGIRSPPFRSETPAPPLPTPPAHLAHYTQSQSESRRFSQPPPPKMSTRSVSEEKEQAKVHQRWIPPPDPYLFGPSHHSQAYGLARPASAAPGSRGISSAAAQAQASRYTSTVTAT